MAYDPKEAWVQAYAKAGMEYPAEYVIRIFKGQYPKLNLDKDYSQRTIGDVGCGQGRHLIFLASLGFHRVYGAEISLDIANIAMSNVADAGFSSKVCMSLGDNKQLKDFSDLDYLLSWNACYYMGDDRDFSKVVAEFARALKPDGYLVMSIPKNTCFIYENSKEICPGYREIVQDPFGTRVGEVLKIFEDENDIEQTFSSHFKNFIFASDEDDCFGYAYHWHIVVCQKK